MNSVIELPRLVIRPGNSDDRRAVRTLVQSVWEEVYGPHVPAGAPTRRDPSFFEDLAGDPGDGGWVAVLGSGLVGYCRVLANSVDQIWVSARMRRRRVGSRLLEKATGAIGARGFAHAQVGFEDFNPAVRAFFDSHGWQRIAAERQVLGGGRSCQALVYSIRLE